jgi:hypothetical protein
MTRCSWGDAVVHTDRLEVLRYSLRLFVEERDWGQYHSPKNLTMELASEAGELQAEIGVVAIILLCLCDRLGLDLIGHRIREIGPQPHQLPCPRKSWTFGAAMRIASAGPGLLRSPRIPEGQKAAC